MLNPDRLIFCIEEGDTSYMVWSGQNRNMIEYPKHAGVSMIRGRYYSISPRIDEAPTPVATPPFPMRIVSSAEDEDGSLIIVLTARAPVFTANQIPGTGLYIGFSEFFGRVLIDSVVAVPLRIYACYECQLVLLPNEDYGTQWVVKEVVAKLPTVPKLCLVRPPELRVVFEDVADEGASCICSQTLGKEGDERQYSVLGCDFLERCFGLGYQPSRGMPLTLIAIPVGEDIQELQGICAATIDYEVKEKLELIGEMVEPPTGKKSIEIGIEKLKIQAWIADDKMRQRLREKNPALLQGILGMLMGDTKNGNGA